MSMNTVLNILLVVGFLVLILARLHMSYSMLFIAFVYILISKKMPMSFLAQTMVSGSTKYSLLAVPLFMAAGEIMNQAGISQRMFDFADSLVGHVKGGLGHVNVLASLFFAGVSGSAAADAAGLGNIEIQAMLDKGYDVDFSVGITATSSIIGPIFPPSSPMILLGTLTGISVGSLFMGGAVLGVIMTLVMMVIVYFIAKNRNYPVSEKYTWKQRWYYFKRAFLALLLPVFMIVTLTTGIVSTTEVGALSVMYSLFLGKFVYKELTWKNAKSIFERVVNNTGMIMLLIAGGNVLAGVMGVQQLPTQLGNWLLGVTENKVLLTLLMLGFILFMGTFLDTSACLLLSIPLLFPMAGMLELNMVHFCITLIFGLMIGLLTPPMAICLFITSKIGGISFERAFKAVTVYYIPLIILLLIIAFVPEITLWLPRLVYGTV